jgi:BirA family transcriptional regulator, biotin operon repressor / biotin---[acetyl-CoA-carboxylase] ligase
LYKIPATTLFLGKKLIFMPECHSTNDLMLLLCQQEPAPEGTVIITVNQTAGRGQRGNRWETEPGKNLTFSLLLKPAFLAIQKQFYLNIFVSLGIRDYLTEQSRQKVHIKWPNDILINEKKICGILIENQIQGNSLVNSVVGIGLNVNQQLFTIDTATSLLLITGRTFDLSQSLDALMHFLEIRYLQLRGSKFELLKRDYLDSLFRLHEPHQFSDQHGRFEGIITGIDDIGRLTIQREQLVISYDLKEIWYE